MTQNVFKQRAPSIACLITSVLLSCTFQAKADSARPEIIVYPAPDGIERSTAFSVSVEGKPLPVYKTKIPPKAPIPRLSGSRSEFSYVSLASFDMKGTVQVEKSWNHKLVPGSCFRLHISPLFGTRKQHLSRAYSYAA